MCVKKFIFSKFAGLQAYNWQLYKQMNSFTYIFHHRLKLPHAPPMYWLKPPPYQILECPPMSSKPVGNPALISMGGFVKYVVHFLMETQVIELLLINQEN